MRPLSSFQTYRPCVDFPPAIASALAAARHEAITARFCVAEIGGKAVLAFRAEADDEASAVIDDDRGAMRSDLRALTGTDGNPLWDGKSVIHVRLATATEHAEWEQSRDQAISDGEIDLNAGDDPDEWNVSFPR